MYGWCGHVHATEKAAEECRKGFIRKAAFSVTNRPCDMYVYGIEEIDQTKLVKKAFPRF